MPPASRAQGGVGELASAAGAGELAGFDGGDCPPVEVNQEAVQLRALLFKRNVARSRIASAERGSRRVRLKDKQGRVVQTFGDQLWAPADINGSWRR